MLPTSATLVAVSAVGADVLWPGSPVHVTIDLDAPTPAAGNEMLAVWWVTDAGGWYGGWVLPLVAGQTHYEADLARGADSYNDDTGRFLASWHPDGGDWAFWAWADDVFRVLTVTLDDPAQGAHVHAGAQMPFRCHVSEGVAAGAVNTFLVDETNGAWYGGWGAEVVAGRTAYEIAVDLSPYALTTRYTVYAYYRPDVNVWGDWWSYSGHSSLTLLAPVIRRPAGVVVLT